MTKRTPLFSPEVRERAVALLRKVDAELGARVAGPGADGAGRAAS